MSRRIRGPTETQLHLSVANLLDWVLLPPAFYTTFPAGWGVLSPSMAQRLKKCGMKAGMPDIMIFYAGRCCGIELKTGKNTVTQEQRETHGKLRAAGVPVHVCRSLDDVMNVLLGEFPTRNINGGEGWQPNRNAPLPVEIYARPDASGDTGDGDGAENRETG